MHLLAATALLLVSGFDPPFIPPSEGIGVEARFQSARAYAMGGSSAGIPDSNSVSIFNPAASAWTEATGLTWGIAGLRGDDRNWTGKETFPHLSLVVPAPYGLSLSGSLSSRSRLSASTSFSSQGLIGTGDWTGGLTEGYFGLTTRAGESLAFSLGSRSTFGYIRGDIRAHTESPSGPYIRLLHYIDEAVLDPAGGLLFAGFWKAGLFNMGMSITTDRSGILNIKRDRGGNHTHTSTRVDFPGDFTAGFSVRPHERWLVAGDYYFRKRLNLLGVSVEPGSIYSGGVEYSPTGSLRLRAGVAGTEGLWRDGSLRYTGGIGFSFGGGRACLDLSGGYETWGDGMSETTFYATLWASENWLR